MSYANYDEVISTLRAHAFDVSHLELCYRKRIKRIDHSQKGWLSLYEHTNEDGSVSFIGAFGYWMGNETFIQTISPGAGVKLTSEQKAAINKRIKEIKKQNKLEEDKVRAEASRIATITWHKLVHEGQSEYLARKGVEANGIRFFEGEPIVIESTNEANEKVFIEAPLAKGDIAIPAKDINGVICGLQIIRGKNRGGKLEKQFWPKGMRMGASHHIIGIINRQTSIFLLAEGYATAMTLHAATGLPVVVAYFAHNLMPVAEALHKQFPRAKILICADDDYLSPGNPGVSTAQNAATAVGGSWVKPEFPFDREDKPLTDFNDLANGPGCTLSTVIVQIEEKLQSLDWGLKHEPQAIALDSGGGGKRNAAVSIMSLDDLVERFIFIDDVTGDYVFDTWTHDVCKFGKMTRLMPPNCRIEFIKSNPMWQSRAVYVDQIGFDPGNEDKNIICNRWRGWPMQPKQGNCQVALDLLRYLCGENDNSDKVYEWVLKWLAYPLQNAGAKMQSAIVMHGNQGTGKSMFFEAYAKIFGEYAAILNQGALDDKFNADWAEKKQFVIADEVAANSEKYQLKNQLKTLITGEWVRVNPKNVAAHRERNHMNLVFLSNENMPVVLENDDRRHCIIKTPEALPQDSYDMMRDEIKQGGIEALYHYLLGLDLTGFGVETKPPFTEAKAKLIWLSSGSDSRFIDDWRHGYISELPFCPAGRREIYDTYKSWCKKEGEFHPRSSKDFFSTIENLQGWRAYTTDRYETLQSTTKVSWRVIVPSEKDMAESMKLNPKQKDYRQKATQNKTEWLTDCYFVIYNAQQDTGNEAADGY